MGIYFDKYKVMDVVKMVTIKDIAKESGYSISTVSRVLNHRTDVSSEAKEKIEKIVAQYNFVPNNNAKQLKQTASRTIGVIVKGTSNVLFHGIVEAIQKLMEKTTYTTDICYLDEDDNEVEQAIMMCRERKPIGILFLGGNLIYFKESFCNVKVPCVILTNQSNELDKPNLSSVATDDRMASKAAIDYLIKNGHRNIGIIGGDWKISDISRLRYEGCRMSFQQHNVEYDEATNYQHSRFSYDNAYEAMKRMVKISPNITAVFAMSDVTAIGAIRALRDMGYHVPNDISVVGFDGIDLAKYYNPKLTTIRQQHEGLATRGLEILLKMIDLNMEAIHEVIPFEFQEGESVRKI